MAVQILDLPDGVLRLIGEGVDDWRALERYRRSCRTIWRSVPSTALVDVQMSLSRIHVWTLQQDMAGCNIENGGVRISSTWVRLEWWDYGCSCNYCSYIDIKHCRRLKCVQAVNICPVNLREVLNILQVFDHVQFYVMSDNPCRLYVAASL